MTFSTKKGNRRMTTRLFLIYITPFLFTILSNQPLHGQGIKGQITDTNSKPIPFATIYFKELAKGLTANKEGKRLSVKLKRLKKRAL